MVKPCYVSERSLWITGLVNTAGFSNNMRRGEGMRREEKRREEKREEKRKEERQKKRRWKRLEERGGT